MKKKMKNYFGIGILFLGISITLINCEKDPVPIEEHVHHDFPFKISQITSSEIQQNIKLSTKLEDLKMAIVKVKKEHENKSDEPDLYDFTIDTEFANYIENEEGDYHSYTFAIKRDYDYGPLENLLLAYDETKGYKAYLIKYNFTYAEKEAFFSGQEIDLTDITQTMELDISCLNIDFGSKAFTCIVAYRAYCTACMCYVTDCDENCSGNFLVESSYLVGCYDLGDNGGSGGTSGTSDGVGTGDTGEGGDSSGDYDNEPNGGSDSSDGDTTTDPEVTTPTPCIHDCPPSLEETIDAQNCEKLQDMLDPAKANIKPAIEHLKKVYETANWLTKGGEAGAHLSKTGDTYSNEIKELTAARSFKIKKGGAAYGAIHTHPYTGLPMFSYADLFGLMQMYDEADPLVKSEVTLMLICDDIHGDKQTYAIKINNFYTFKNKILTTAGIITNTPENLIKIKLHKMDEDMGKEYSKYEDPERGFLEIFKDFQLSLYKADVSGNSFEKLNIIRTSPTSTEVVPTPCNDLH